MQSAVSVRLRVRLSDDSVPIALELAGGERERCRAANDASGHARVHAAPVRVRSGREYGPGVPS